MFMFRLEKMFVMFSSWRLFIVVYIVEKWHCSTFVDSLKDTNIVTEFWTNSLKRILCDRCIWLCTKIIWHLSGGIIAMILYSRQVKIAPPTSEWDTISTNVSSFVNMDASSFHSEFDLLMPTHGWTFAKLFSNTCPFSASRIKCLDQTSWSQSVNELDLMEEPHWMRSVSLSICRNLISAVRQIFSSTCCFNVRVSKKMNIHVQDYRTVPGLI